MSYDLDGEITRQYVERLQSQLAMANAVIGDLSKELRDYADTHVSMRRFYEYLDKYPGEVKG